MTRDEIVTALRCCTSSPSVWECKAKCAFYNGGDMGKCIPEMGSAAADLIENQQGHIEVLIQANDSLKNAIARRNKQIENMKQGMAQLAKVVAVKEENDGTADRI